MTQPPLASYGPRVPDFLWLTQSSDTDQPVLIEIEARSKRWFTKAGRQTANLTAALDQIAEWKSWFDIPYNVEAFKAFYGLQRDAWLRRSFKPAYLLIYGRRREANANPALTNKRSHLTAQDVVTMTYDRLQPNPKADQFCCIRPAGPGSFQVVSVPATLKWIPGLAHERSLIHGWNSAIQANVNISQERKAFLIRRGPYWEEWGRLDDHAIIRSGDEE